MSLLVFVLTLLGLKIESFVSAKMTDESAMLYCIAQLIYDPFERHFLSSNFASLMLI